MRLTTFLETSHGPILDAAVEFARTIPALENLEDHVLRDHLPELLKVISADLVTPQSRTDSITKSEGGARQPKDATSAQIHGLMRARSGLTIEQLVAEFRALRSSALRLWAEAHPPGPEVIEDITRFNEAIDQAVAESVQFYAEERERWRDLFLGVLGHDLRGPLNALALTAESMRMSAGGTASPQVLMMQRGVKRLSTLLDSLLEYSRSNLGVGMALQPGHVDLASECTEELDLLHLAHPGARIDCTVSGDLTGSFDASRVREALANLVSNAVKHGNPDKPITVHLEGDEHAVRLEVENAGDIPAEEIDMLFEPLYQRSTPSAHKDRTHLGLGLFVVKQIAKAHGGNVRGTSSAGRVRFVIEVPKAAATETK